MGISMGGMQTFEWLVSHPDFMDRAVPIVGSPQLTGYDLVLWEAQLRTIEQCLAAGCDDPGFLVRLMSELIVSTPQQQNRNLHREEIDETVEGLRASAENPFRPLDYASQLRAMLTHDVASGFDGDLTAAAGQVQADLLAVVATFDHGVTPEAARTFTSLVGGTLLELDSECGHVVFSCERPLIGHAVRGFLTEGTVARR
jgi:homoserine O-acetyltransferase